MFAVLYQGYVTRHSRHNLYSALVNLRRHRPAMADSECTITNLESWSQWTGRPQILAATLVEQGVIPEPVLQERWDAYKSDLAAVEAWEKASSSSPSCDPAAVKFFDDEKTDEIPIPEYLENIRKALDFGVPEEEKKCDCGAKVAKTTCATWCSTNE